MFSAKNTWEKTYFYQDENLNYPAIKKGLNENILTTINDLLFFVNTNIKELKSKDSNLEEHCQRIQSIFKKYIENFENITFKENLINSLITTNLDFYLLNLSNLSLNFKSEALSENTLDLEKK